jgi:anti-sigma regulatory factor (Ser/Thr protein kinase)
VPESDDPERTESWSFKADVAAPSAARAVMREFVNELPAMADDISGMVLCVSEAITNAVLHAYRDSTSPGTVEMDAAAFATHVWITVRDSGQGLTPRIGSPGLGVGLPIISQTATATEIRTPQTGGTEIAMRFELRPT